MFWEKDVGGGGLREKRFHSSTYCFKLGEFMHNLAQLGCEERATS